MTNLIKPYEIAIYTDKVGDSGTFEEERICIIGSDQMTFQGRALEPELTRNVNGQNKLTFKMYKHYVDVVTGEEQENPFIQYLISERKVKLKYGKDDDGNDIWYDFIIKDITENSSTYLYTYSLEDAIVQELSKNGFGTTLDAALMNNIGNSQSLGEAIMAETDWDVEAEKIVETIEEALVYIELPANQLAWHILDQTKDEEEHYSSGVTIEDTQINLGGKTVLAFYSSCKNKPHRFQFIYSDKGYNIEQDECISRRDDRLINEDNCQYYIDFDTPEVNYTVNDSTFDFYLPTDFKIVISPFNDTTISSNYRGKRYAYAPQAVYVPLLDKYCSRFEKKEGAIEFNSELYASGSGNEGISLSDGIYTKKTEYSGVKIKIPNDYQNGETYKLSYTLAIKGGQLQNIGGHNHSFLTKFFVEGYGSTKNDFYSFSSPLTNGTIKIEAYYLKKKNDSDSQPYLFIQPNRGLTTEVSFSISNLSITSDAEYLSYVDTEYVSPALVQNYINNYNFDSAAGWTITSASRTTLNADPKITNCYGRFIGSTFRSMIDDFLKGEYSEDNTYTAYMQVTFTEPGQFVLNSGLRDNRSIIGNLEEGAELIVDCEITTDGTDTIGLTTNSTDTVNLLCSIGEYKYNQTSGGYDEITGLIGFSSKTIEGKTAFEVTSTSYTKETFKKNSKLYLSISGPRNFSTDENGNYIPKTYYIKKALLYKKVLNADGNLIVPDYDTKNSSAAEDYVDNSVIKNTYNYFPRWLIDYSMVNNAEEIPLKAFESLTYETFKPIYNDGAEKIRTVSIKESNYFNNLQTLAETFEQWLIFEIGRTDNGSINSKKVYFKNYRGKDNYACFRYGVNLQDIQRTYASKNIVTKLIVKNNSNEHAKNGFCTIQRAGANPTGENYLYDFQYYQNQGIMPVDSYLKDTYYMDDSSKGPDSIFWNGSMTNSSLEEMTLKGYYPRIKKLNEELLPINETIANKKIDLLSYQSEEEVAKSTYDAALSSIGVVREDFKALTGIYPEEAQDDKLKSISVISAIPQDSWYKIDSDPVISGNEVSVNIKALASNSQVYPTAQFTQGISTETVTSPYVYKITKGSEWDGIYLDFEYVKETEYILEYDLTLNTTKVIDSSSSLINIGCHNDGAFEASYDGEDELPFITITRLSNGDSVSKNIDKNNINSIILDINDLLDSNETTFPAGQTNSSLHVTLQGKYNPTEKCTSPYFWIQPNRGTTTPVTCTISNIRMYVRGGAGATAGYTRKAYVDLTIGTMIDNGSDSGTPGPNRKYTVEIPVPAGEEQATATQIVAAVDTERSDVRKYLEEYTVHHEKLESSTDDKIRLASNIATLNTTINELETKQKDYLSWKQKLNQLFFKKYCRFIQEGTWINEECVDDEKYYTDAQSVLYNSCYPQVAYTINVLELSQLPGYELFKFEVGDKTWAIDDEFFGDGHREEVIITELSEQLDDPSKNKIKVQNFKNQFQDLFQKITATVQQTQYSTGAYEKGAALMEANDAKKSEFITNAINSAASFLAPGKSHTVTWEGGQGITVTDDKTPTNQVRIVGGAILLSTEDPKTKEQTWITGVTNEGISANLITAGRLDTGAIQIMSGTEPVFRWDAYGISAYDAVWYDEGTMKTISGINSKKFVRFDKNGIYGINSEVLDEVVDGSNWHPSSIDDIDQKATFALTWDGLKVTGNNKTTARIGKQNGYIMVVENADGKQTFRIKNDGSVQMAGSLTIVGTLDDDTNQSVEEYVSSAASETLISAKSYTDNITNQISADFQSFKGDYANDKTNLENAIGGCIKTTDLSVTREQDEATGLYVTITKYNDITTKTFEDATGQYLLTNVGKGTTEENGTYFEVSADGLLTANNAIIHGTIFANAGRIGGLTIGDIENNISNDNLLPNSAFYSGLGWSSLSIDTGSNADGTSWTRTRKITDFPIYNGHSALYINVTGQTQGNEAINNFVWNGSSKNLAPEDASFKAGEYVTISCWCNIISLPTAAGGKTAKNRLGFALKGYEDDGAWNNGNGPTVFEGDQRIGTGWIKLQYTLQLSTNLNRSQIYVYIAQNGEAYFTDFKVERGQTATAWKANSSDEYNNGINLYTGTNITLTATPTNQYCYQDLYSTLKIEENKPYYFSANVNATWRTGLAEEYKKIAIGFFNYYDDILKDTIIKLFDIVDNKISGTLYFPRRMNGYLTDHLLIYAGVNSQTQGNTVTFSNIRIEEGTIEAGTTSFNNTNGDFSWQFSPTSGIKMWDGPQTNEPVFKIWNNNGKHELYVEGHIVATSLNLGTNKISHNNVSGLSEIATSGDYNDLLNKPTSVADLGFDTSKVIYKGDITSQSKTDSNGISYTQTKVPDGKGGYIIYDTYDAGDYMVLGRSKGTNAEGQTYVAIGTDGLLTARNAVIYGTIYASSGEFTGKITANDGEIGGLKIFDNYLAGEGYYIDKGGIVFQNQSQAKLSFTNFYLEERLDDSNRSWGIIESTGLLDIGLKDSAKFSFNKSSTGVPFNLTFENQNSGYSDLKIKITSSIVMSEDFEFTLYWCQYNSAKTGDDKYRKGEIPCKISKGQSSTIATSDGPEWFTGEQYLGVSSISAYRAQQIADGRLCEWKDTSKTYGKEMTYWQGGTDEGMIHCKGHFAPLGGGTYSLGTAGSYWKQIYGNDCYFSNVYDRDAQSDFRVKNSIEKLPEKYEIFYDKMLPARYKYNEGSSNRFHTGFIAQQLVSALEEAELSTLDFAGVVLWHPGKQDECWYLRRDEFVALNTWQIQKLKPRVSALEQTILNYETRISSLETEIQNLKNS